MSLLNKPRLLCDANIPYKISELLLKEGFDVKRPPFQAEDNEVAMIANKEDRVIITFDRHFGNINLFPPEKYSGIIFIRISPQIIDIVFPALKNLFDTIKLTEFKGKLYVLSISGFRVFPRTFPKSKK